MNSYFCSLTLLTAIAVGFVVGPVAARDSPEPAKKKLGFGDLMKFRTIKSPVLADDGSWLAYELRPDRGDREVEVTRADGRSRHSIPLGSKPALTSDGNWATAILKPTLEAVETAKDDKPESGFALLDTQKGDLVTWQHVKRGALSKDGQWLAVLHTKKAAEAAEEASTESEQAKEESSGSEASAAEQSAAEKLASEQSVAEELASEETTAEETTAEEATEGSEDAVTEEDEKEERAGATLHLRRLADGTEIEIEHVTSFAFDDTSAHLAYAVAAPGGENGLWLRDLARSMAAEPEAVTTAERGHYTALTWARDRPSLAFVAAVDDSEGEPGDGAVWLWQGDADEGRAVAGSDTVPDGWFVPSVNELTFSRDGQRLFYGTRPRPTPKPPEDEDKAFDPYDFEALLDDVGLDVWHADDPLIKSNERKEWEETEKERTYLAIYHLDSASQANVQLADQLMRDVEPVDNGRAAIGIADVPYLRQRTFEGFFGDLYWVSLEDGDRTLITERLSGLGENARLSPDGRFTLWYQNQHWHLFDADTQQTRNLTSGFDEPFGDEDHDYPSPVASHGTAGWLEDSSAVLIYDRYDIWRFPVDTATPPTNVTAGKGREERLRLRLIDEDEDEPFLDPEHRLLLEGYSETNKTFSFWELSLKSSEQAPKPLLDGANAFSFIARAKDADKVLYTRESYREFPDLWLATAEFKEPRKLSDANPQIADFAWGNAELVNFTDSDGVDSDAVLIRPEGMKQGERCPVLVYYYRFYSQRLHRFNAPKVNHRPSFPVYASHGYCIFLPDIRFEIGRPGLSATKALVPAVQKIVDMGVADPDALGLHGHSWSGYQTAHVITQTNTFAAAVAGAPVSNMTSAYGGIRYGTGLARQFQYESGQSRLGASLWQARDLYIENSPLFFADRIETPLLIQFGDKDEAVPWTQGVELYLALRRLGKEAVLLQYHGEPHHLKRYSNKLDYSIKMKEFFDHYLKGAPAPSWLREGEPFRGDDAD